MELRGYFGAEELVVANIPSVENIALGFDSTGAENGVVNGSTGHAKVGTPLEAFDILFAGWRNDC
jgi:hypothetical protein